jgi:phosphate/sulfate permease
VPFGPGTHCYPGSVCFARAVNDTPKIAALLLAATALGGQAQPVWVIALVALVMAAGGLIQGRRAAETMSRRITLNPAVVRVVGASACGASVAGSAAQAEPPTAFFTSPGK